MAGEKEKPLTREDVRDAIGRHGGGAWDLDLSGKTFATDVDLSNLDLRGIILNKAVLLGAKFDGSNLKGAKLREANLQHATFNKYDEKVTDLREADLSGASLEDAEFKEANLEGAQFGDKEEPDMMTPLFDTDFRGANLRFIDFIACAFFRTKLEGTHLFKTNFYESDLKWANWGSYIIGEEREGRFYTARDTYQQLKVWYTNAGIADIAAKFYYREKEASRKALNWRSKLWYHRLVLEASYRFFGYGERWRNILLWIAVVVFGFAAAYYFRGSFSSSSFLDTLYYSAASFTALGYGQWAPQPTGWAKYVGAVEAFIGVSMMALFLITFVRKWTR